MWACFLCCESRPQGEGAGHWEGARSEVCCRKHPLLWPFCPARPHPHQAQLSFHRSYLGLQRSGKRRKWSGSWPATVSWLLVLARSQEICIVKADPTFVQPVERFCMIILCPVTTHPHGLARMMPVGNFSFTIL